MADVWVQIQFEDANGKHLPGKKITLPTDTPEDAAALAVMIDYGIVTDQQPSTDSSDEPEGRSRPGRRTS